MHIKLLERPLQTKNKYTLCMKGILENFVLMWFDWKVFKKEFWAISFEASLQSEQFTHIVQSGDVLKLKNFQIYKLLIENGILMSILFIQEKIIA